jgi:hypothetical protein
MLQLRGRGDCLLQKKNTEGSMRNEGGGEEDRSTVQKLNITDEFTDKIIPSVILSVQMLCHRMICLFRISV